MAYVLEDWEQHYADGRKFRPLGDSERALLAEHARAPEGGGRALDVGCGTGELAAHLVGLGYAVDAVDFAASAVERARVERGHVEGVRWLRLDIERDDPAQLSEDGYDLIALRLMYPFLGDRTRVLHALGERLRPGGGLVVITPTVEHTPATRRAIALDEDEISLLTAGWEKAQRLAADDLAVLVLRGPCHTDTKAIEKGPPTGHALTGAVVVVTDDAGRVLLGRSRQNMWELPAGKTSGSESFEETAVRELAEETGLTAGTADASAVTMLTDDSHGVPRLTAVIRISAWTGTLANPEKRLFDRWEWHDLHALACLGDVFAPAAQALNAIWPGVIPGLPAIHAYPTATDQPPVPGEPGEAVRLRRQMADAVIAAGWAPSAPVQSALCTVPRHRFAPEKDLATAYDDEQVVVTRWDESGRATSSVSAAWLQADMIEKLRLEPGAGVLEVGSGGYNAELIAHVVGEGGRVVTVDIDPYVVHRTRRFPAEAGSGRVLALQGDGALGAPARHVPRGGFDGCVITHNVWDIAPAWRQQLTEGATLVVPMEVHGYTRAIAFERRGDVLHATGWTYCGFVRDLGQNGHTTPVVDLAGGELRLRFEDGPVGDTAGLEEALRGPRHEVRTGVTVAGGESFETLQLYLATTVPGFCRLAGDRDKDTGIAAFARSDNAAALLGDGCLAYLTYVWVRDGETPAERRAEFVVHAFGERGLALAEQLAGAVHLWDQHVRGHGYPQLTVHPATTPDGDLPAGHVLDKRLNRLVYRWPGSDAPLSPTTAEPVARTTG
ncbi:protein-L-isoaspartate(D-aspartate) O-methyltransferase [Kitasatospora sp. GP30]|uniref:methyltransferase, FxLD system n=1 Tax=Kitasatospora sp. GP30 TaxID=3035084 RepID=UPI000C7101FF|nr:methyltransferase, FxLD system [Kitasatospora sp. GP30]MDH6143520.1 protein-L-isoaspartate(D-aspartate) O-methyltransferase [Kitasatospora sp. GP30]